MKPVQEILPIKKILAKFNGLHYSQEYLCISKESFTRPLHAYLVNDKCVIKDITNQYRFVGYSPLIFAFWHIELPSSPEIIYSNRILQLNEIFSAKDALAVLSLELIHKQATENNFIFYYKGTRGSHHFLSGFHQFIGGLINDLYNKRQGNVFLPNDLYKQVQVAYAVPRIISLITVGSNELYNLFPSDLHGQVDEQHYIISLRVGGKACEQAEKAGRLLISQVHSNACKMVYEMGKNHMQELKPVKNFPFSAFRSQNFGLPLPEQALSYKELALQDSFILGIHKLFLFKVITSHQIQPQNDTLAHIHNSYASWRYKNGLPGNYLLR